MTPIPQCFPELAVVKQAFAAGRPTYIPLARRVLSDALSPVLAYRRLVKPDDRLAPSFLLESVVGGQRIGRYSFLGARPVMQVVAYGHEVTLTDTRAGTKRTEHHDDPLQVMRRLTREYQGLKVQGLPDFTGGWVGYAGYDTVRYVEAEKLPSPPPDDRELPDLHFGLYLDIVAFDHVQKTVLLITHVDTQRYCSSKQACDAGLTRLDALEESLKDKGDDLVSTPHGHIDLASPPPTLPVSNMGPGGYQRAVEKCKQYIAAGDAFQIVPSQRFSLHTQADPFDVYRTLRVVNPSPYMFYLQAAGAILVGSSPEILVRVEDGIAASRPLAGTRKRGATDAEDAALEAEMRSDPKDVAEHVMLVDLHRNDIGRVAVPGTITLPEVLVVERYSHVMHLSSEVRGKMREGLDAWDALRHSLPVGTVSGAPKVRAMQIIDELEPCKRGPYGGAVGYADFAGNMDMCIALRTMVCVPQADPQRPSEGEGSGRFRGWRIDLQAGAGIVADSVPDLEHQETVNKAAALAKAVSLAESLFAGERPR
jgi:anthranilate synthase component 1